MSCFEPFEDVPNYIGPDKPSRKLKPYLKYLFPHVENPESNIFFRYGGGRCCLVKMGTYLREMMLSSNDDVTHTVVIENGASATEAIDKMFAGYRLIGCKRSSGLYNCYQWISCGGDRPSFNMSFCFFLRDLLTPNWRRIVKWEHAHRLLNGPIASELNSDLLYWNTPLVKYPDVQFIPLYRSQISRALRQPEIPTLVGLLAESQNADSLLMDAKTWISGSMFLVESVLAFHLWRETTSVVFYHFDCRVERLMSLLDEYRKNDRKVRCLRLVIKYKCLRSLIDLQLLIFLIEHQNEDYQPLGKHPLTADREERFQQANRIISKYSDRLRELGDNRNYIISPKKKLVVDLTSLMGHRQQVRDEIQFCQNTLNSLAQEAEDDGKVTLSEAIVTVSGIIFDQSLHPAAILGPAIASCISTEHIHPPIFLKSFVGFTHEQVHLTGNQLTRTVRCNTSDITLMHEFSIQWKRIRWEWIENPSGLAIAYNTTVEKLKRNLGNYLRGRIRLGDLTLSGLQYIDNALRMDNAQKARELESLSIGTKRYVVELYRYLVKNTLEGGNPLGGEYAHNSLKWNVKMQYLLHLRLQELRKRARAERARRFLRRQVDILGIRTKL